MAKFLFYVVLSGEGDTAEEAWANMADNLSLGDDVCPETVLKEGNILEVMKALDECGGCTVEVEDENDDSRDAYGDRNLESQSDT